MGLRQTITQWLATVKDTLDFGQELPVSAAEHRTTLSGELARLQMLLEETRRATQEKDELIAQLQAAGTVHGDMIVDGSAYYIKRETSLEGPFCTSCFEHHHQIARIVPTPKPKDADGDPAEWVQCGQCQTPFRSERIGQYLNPRPTAVVPTATSPEEKEETKPVEAGSKTRRRRVRPKTNPRSRRKPHPADERPGNNRTLHPSCSVAAILLRNRPLGCHVYAS